MGFNANKYKKNRDTRKNYQTFDVQMPSGETFKLRPVDLSVYLASGQFPSSYVAKMVSMQNKSAIQKQEVIANFTEAEQLANLEFLGCIVRAACVEPRINPFPQSDSEIAFDDLDDEDIIAVYQWAVGGVSSPTAANFQPRPGENA